jgi:hypothetical protein
VTSPATSTPTTGPATATPTPNPHLAALIAGATARSGGLAITIVETADPCAERNQFEQPASGTHYVGLRLILENNGKGDYFHERSELRVTDENGFSS